MEKQPAQVGATRNRLSPTILFAGDLVVLLLFVFIGQRDHSVDDPQPVLRLIVTTAYFALPWTIAALLLGGDRSEPAPLRRHIGLALNGWLIAAPLGALLRSFANGSGVILSPFLVVTLLVGATLLLVWRLAYALLLKRRA